MATRWTVVNFAGEEIVLVHAENGDDAQWKVHTAIRRALSLRPEEYSLAEEDTCGALPSGGGKLTFVRHSPEVATAIENIQQARFPKDVASTYSQLPQDLIATRKIALVAMRLSGRALGYAPLELRADRAVVQMAVQNDGRAVKFASTALREDPEIARLAVSSTPYALKYVGAALRANRGLVLRAVQWDPYALQWADPLLRNDHEIALMALEQTGCANILAHVSSALCGSLSV